VCVICNKLALISKTDATSDMLTELHDSNILVVIHLLSFLVESGCQTFAQPGSIIIGFVIEIGTLMLHFIARNFFRPISSTKQARYCNPFNI